MSGAVAAVVRLSDDATWTSARGLSRADAITAKDPAAWTGEAMTTGKVFRIASVTKTFTATVVLLLAEDGALSLDDTVERWLPGLVATGSSVTVRRLLNMTSLLREYTTGEFNDYVDDNPETVWTPTQLIDVAEGRDGRFEPGDRADSTEYFNYMNTNYVLLGMIAEKASGKTYAQLVQEKIFTPLGMTHSSVPSTSAMPADGARGYLYAGGGWYDTTERHPSFIWSAGCILSTLEDMIKWGKALTSGQLLSEASWREMLKLVPLEGCDDFRYGAGISMKAGALGHNGTLIGYTASVYRFQGYLFVALANCHLLAEGVGHAADTITSALAAQAVGVGFDPCENTAGSGKPACAATQPAGTTLTLGDSKVWDISDGEGRGYSMPLGARAICKVREFSATLSSGSKGVFTFTTSALSGPLSEVSLVKLKPDGSSIAYGRYIEGAPTYAEGEWWVEKSTAPGVTLSLGSTLDPSASYVVSFVVVDNGTYDLDDTVGIIRDPVVLAEVGASSSGDSTGCVAGGSKGSVLLLLLLAGTALIAQARRGSDRG